MTIFKLKNRTITAERQRTELKVWAACFLFAFLLNVFSIIFYKTELKELYTQLFWVLALSMVVYVLVVLVRVLFALVYKSFSKRKRMKSL